MDNQVKFQIESILVNDEESSDTELLERFMTEFNLPKKLAEKFVSQRGSAMQNPEFQLRLK